MAHEIINPSSVHKPRGYSHVARVGSTLYIAGQVALDPQGNLVGKGDLEAQMHQVFGNLKNILEEMGGGLESIVKTSVASPPIVSSSSHSRGKASNVFCNPPTRLYCSLCILNCLRKSDSRPSNLTSLTPPSPCCSC